MLVKTMEHEINVDERHPENMEITEQQSNYLLDH